MGEGRGRKMKDGYNGRQNNATQNKYRNRQTRTGRQGQRQKVWRPPNPKQACEGHIRGQETKNRLRKGEIEIARKGRGGEGSGGERKAGDTNHRREVSSHHNLSRKGLEGQILITICDRSLSVL